MGVNPMFRLPQTVLILSRAWRDYVTCNIILILRRDYVICNIILILRSRKRYKKTSVFKKCDTSNIT